MISRGQIQAGSATLLATASSASAVFLEPYLSDATTIEKTVAAVVGVPLLYMLFRLSEMGLRWLHFRDVLGEWYYVTTASSTYVDEGFATMRIFFNRHGQLHYHVQLYPDLKSLKAGSNSKGKAISEALEYDADQKELHVLYKVNLISDAHTRRGRLFLSLTQSKELIGEWSSVIESRSVVSHGRFFAARPKEFENKRAAWQAFDREKDHD